MQGNDVWEPERFAGTLEELRDHLNVSQARLAEWARVGQPQVSRWKRGTSRPGYDALRRLLDAARSTDPDDLALGRLVVSVATSAGYAGMDVSPETEKSKPAPESQDSRQLGADETGTRVLDTPFGEVIEEIIEDFDADTEDWSDEERDEAERQLRERFRLQYAEYMRQQEALREQQRKRKHRRREY